MQTWPLKTFYTVSIPASIHSTAVLIIPAARAHNSEHQVRFTYSRRCSLVTYE